MTISLCYTTNWFLALWRNKCRRLDCLRLRARWLLPPNIYCWSFQRRFHWRSFRLRDLWWLVEQECCIWQVCSKRVLFHLLFQDSINCVLFLDFLEFLMAHDVVVCGWELLWETKRWVCLDSLKDLIIFYIFANKLYFPAKALFLCLRHRKFMQKHQKPKINPQECASGT